MTLDLEEDFWLDNTIRKTNTELELYHQYQTSKQPTLHNYVWIQSTVTHEKGGLLAVVFPGTISRI